MYYQHTGGSYVPFDTGKSLNKQKYSDTQTWEDYFVESAVTAVQNIKTLVLAAQAEGFTLSESGKAAVESTMTSLADPGDAAEGFAGSLSDGDLWRRDE